MSKSVKFKMTALLNGAKMLNMHRLSLSYGRGYHGDWIMPPFSSSKSPPQTRIERKTICLYSDRANWIFRIVYLFRILVWSHPLHTTNRCGKQSKSHCPVRCTGVVVVHRTICQSLGHSRSFLRTSVCIWRQNRRKSYYKLIKWRSNDRSTAYLNIVEAAFIAIFKLE